MPQFDDKAIDAKIASLHHQSAEHAVRDAAAQQGLQYVDLHGMTIDTDALQLIPEDTARAAHMAVFDRRNKELLIALRDSGASTTHDALAALAQQGYTTKNFVTSEESLAHAWERYKDAAATTAEKRGVLDVHPETVTKLATTLTAPADVAGALTETEQSDLADKMSRLIEILFGGALALGASDIHIEPEKSATRVRYRLDGVLFDIAALRKERHALLTSRFKLLSGLILNTHDEAQDGRFTFDMGARQLEVRTSVIPGAYGESIVMRLLDPDAASFSLANLGLNETLSRVMQEELQRPNGAILTTGPTGSGKTTALYAFMQEVHGPEVKIITIEDPVEYKLPGIVQTQVEDEYTFESGLRAILRQDPDVIMVGEIRDREVAEVAANAALTGHLVFSTLHTNSAAGAFARLMDLGVDARTIGSAINVVLGQRLVRILCEKCRSTREATTEEQKLVARIMDEPVAAHTVYDPAGCPECAGSGFKGRRGVFEAIRVDQAVVAALGSYPSEQDIQNAARSQGIPTMQQDGIEKVLAGLTSLAELERVVDLHNTRIDTADDTSSDAESATVADHTI